MDIKMVNQMTKYIMYVTEMSDLNDRLIKLDIIK